MSASKERKKRQAERQEGVIDKKAELAIQEKKEKKKIRAAVIAVTAVVVLLLASALFINSKYIRNTLTAVNVGGIDFTVSEFNYYYYDAYYQYTQQVYTNMADYASALLPSSGQPLKSQIYDEETGKTWAEMIEDMAIDYMKEDAVMYADAQKNGFELSAEDRAEMEQEIEDLKETAAGSGYDSFEQYLKAYYGNSITEKSFRKVTEIKYTASAYEDYIKASYDYSPEELEEYYSENSDMLDFYTYRYFMVFADDVDKDLYKDDEEGLEAAEAAELEEAGKKAEEYVKRITDEKSFIEIAKEHNAESYAEEDSTIRQFRGDLLGSVYGPWLRDSSRSYEDVEFIKTTSGYYVVMFIDRSDNHYDTVDARIAHIGPDNVSQSSFTDEDGVLDEEGYNAAVEQAHKESIEETAKLYSQWVDAGATEEEFIKIAGENSDLNTFVEGSDEEGLVKNIDRYKYSYEITCWSEISDWLYDSSRKEGDHEMFESESGAYIVYYKGVGEVYSTYLAQTEKADDEYKEWHDSLGEASVKKTWMFSLAE